MNSPEHRTPIALIVAGVALGAGGLVFLSLGTFHKQVATSSMTGGAAPITLTFNVQPVSPATALFLSWVLAIPLVLAFVPWRFYLTTLVAPAFVALSMIDLVDLQLVAGIVASSMTWVVVGDALVFAGCIVEAVGIVTERDLRAKREPSSLPQGRSSRSAVSRPR